jgi:hypothetical protein
MGLQSIRDVILLLKVVVTMSISFLGSKTFKCVQHPVNLSLKSEDHFRPAHDTATNTELQLPEVVLTQFVSPDDEHDVLETCRELNKNKDKYTERNCASSWSFTKNHYVMHGQKHIKDLTVYNLIISVDTLLNTVRSSNSTVEVPSCVWQNEVYLTGSLPLYFTPVRHVWSAC